MKSLVSLAAPPAHLDYLEAIRDAKKGLASKAELTRHWGRIQGLYARFEAAISAGEIESSPPMRTPASLINALSGCYSPTKGLTSVLDAILAAQAERQLSLCPMCGTTSPQTTDHYLPVVEFSYLAVHPLNLIPCCFRCNATKDRYWIDDAGERLILYMYGDRLPVARFVHVSLHIRAGMLGIGATFSLDRPARFSKKAWRIVESHYRRLHLVDRYNSGANDEISAILQMCRNYRDAGGPDVPQFLGLQSASEAACFGNSHWRSVLMSELVASADFLALV